LVTTIASLELAAALWDASRFLKLNSVFPVSWDSALTLGVLMPAMMCVAAIFAGVGLLQMRRSAWAIWMARHIWLGTVYVLGLPGLLWKSAFIPGYSLIVMWQLGIIAFSLVAGIYLYATKDRFNR
jgi:hypothetical protein